MDIPNVTVLRDEPLALHARFGIGGPASMYVESAEERPFLEALRAARGNGLPWVVVGGGSNLVVSDDGFRGTILRYTGNGLRRDSEDTVWFEAGADLQALVDFTIGQELGGLHTMTGIPGSAGGAVYGNAGAYGRSISESLLCTRFFDGTGIRSLDNAGCEFRYRESIFKRKKEWIILSASLKLEPSRGVDLRKTADDILKIRNEKYPPAMKCAGSIFKNLILAELPEAVQSQIPAKVIREGKVPSAYFLEQVGAKGMRNGGIEVAEYHANLIYNTGNGTARELVEVIGDLKRRVQEKYGILLEEEVQFIGF